MPAAALIRFAFEGDNTPDAAAMADVVEALIPLAFAGVAPPAPAPPSSLLVDGPAPDIALTDLDREYEPVARVAVMVPARPWVAPAAWARLHEGAPEPEY